MAAQEYYSGAPLGSSNHRPSAPPHGYPTPPPDGPPPPYQALDASHAGQPHPQPPYPQQQPPYQQPPPQQQQQKPPQGHSEKPQYPQGQPPQGYGYPPSQGQYLHPQSYQNGPPGAYPPQGQYPPPGPARYHSDPHLHPNYQPAQDTNGRPPRHGRHSHSTSQERKQNDKSLSRLDTFIGAGGGAVIGDAIFPGLGTIGGMLLGGVGGHEYGKAARRRHSDNSGKKRDLSHSRERGVERSRGRSKEPQSDSDSSSGSARERKKRHGKHQSRSHHR